MSKGVFITLEGPDGCGKSTQSRMLCDALETAGYDVVRTFEPGGTAIGRRIREIILDTKSGGMCGITEFLLYAADRAQDVHEVIMPALAAGRIVIGDRFFDSSIAYQGYGLGMDVEAVRAVNAIATRGLIPDLTVLLDIDRPRALPAPRAVETPTESKGVSSHSTHRYATRICKWPRTNRTGSEWSGWVIFL